MIGRLPTRHFEIETPYWMRFAVSKRARENYFKDVQANDAYRSALNQAFDSLAEAAAAKLSSINRRWKFSSFVTLPANKWRGGA
jgi:hypothetical protein